MSEPISRGLLGRGDVGDAWTVLSALFASVFDDHTIGWLNKRGYLRWEQRGQAEAIIAAVNTLIGRHPLRHANFEIGPSHVESFPIGLPLLGVKLTYGRHRKSDAVDPKPTLLWHASKCIVFWQRYQRDAAMHNAPQTFTIQNANRILAEWSKIFGHANAAAVLDDWKNQYFANLFKSRMEHTGVYHELLQSFIRVIKPFDCLLIAGWKPHENQLSDVIAAMRRRLLSASLRCIAHNACRRERRCFLTSDTSRSRPPTAR